MAQRQSDAAESFLDLAADAVAAKHEAKAVERSLKDIRHECRTELEWAADRGHLTAGDVVVIETYLEAGAFDSARQAFRERTDADV